MGWVACSFHPKTQVDWSDTGSPDSDQGSTDSQEDEDIDGGSNDADAGEPDPIEDMDSSLLPAGPSPCRDPVLGLVVDITDGDTVRVETGRGIERVRLIGIDTPEVDHTGPDDECFGEEAALFLAEQIDNERVWLTFDSECDDHYDRTLAYIHTENLFVQRSLLQAGMATAYAVSPNTSFSSVFSSDESTARSENVGLWGECP
jgi:micrococcal nuclease